MRQLVEVGLVGGPPVKARMGPAPVIESEVSAERGARRADSVVGPQVDLLVFDRPPQALDEDVVAPRASAVHADGNPHLPQHAGEGVARKLRTLVGVEDLRLAVPGERFLPNLAAEVSLHGDRQPPGQDPAAEPVDDGGEVDEAAGHRNVGDVHGPDLIGPINRQAAQQIRVDLVPRRWFRGVWLAVERLDVQALHQRRDMAAADHDAFLVQETPQHPAPRKGEFEMQFVHASHHGQISHRDRMWQIIDAAPADPERLGLLGDREIMTAIDHRFALRRPALPSAPDKKSLLSVNSPILACSVFTSMAGAASDRGAAPNTPAAPSRSWAFQVVIWLGWTSNC